MVLSNYAQHIIFLAYITRGKGFLEKAMNLPEETLRAGLEGKHLSEEDTKTILRWIKDRVE